MLSGQCYKQILFKCGVTEKGGRFREFMVCFCLYSRASPIKIVMMFFVSGFCILNIYINMDSTIYLDYIFYRD